MCLKGHWHSSRSSLLPPLSSVQSPEKHQLIFSHFVILSMRIYPYTRAVNLFTPRRRRIAERGRCHSSPNSHFSVSLSFAFLSLFLPLPWKHGFPISTPVIYREMQQLSMATRYKYSIDRSYSSRPSHCHSCRA